MKNMAKLSEVLRARGYVHQFSSEKLEEITDGQKRTVYLGIDPSADSLHVGNLVGLLVLRRFLEDGHKVILLTGGGTGMIGDPGGKSEERNLLDEETVARNTKTVAAQIRRVFGSDEFTEVNNAKWLAGLKLLDFLRDVGKHFTVNAMVKKDIVRDRLESESPISFTEFSYSLLQCYDFLYLNEHYACDMQVGGSDQWSNILAGVEFVRRKSGKTVYAFTWPLLINKATGKKFGKSEEGAIWLSSAKTTPFQFYQFWLNSEDDAVEEYLLKMTLIPAGEIATIISEHKRNPAGRYAQKRLANAVTSLVHGEKVAHVVGDVSAAIFGDKEMGALSSEEQELLRREAPTYPVRLGLHIVDVLVETKLASSKREARQFIEDGAVMLNGGRISDPNRKIMHEDFQDAPLAKLKRGKRNAAILTLG